MLKIGLTGGIGSGKTTAANFFSDLGVPIIDADQIAHEITTKDSEIFSKIVLHFGKDILKTDGNLDRRKLRNIIFNNPQEKNWLETLLHPPILAAMLQRSQKLTAPYCIFVIPLLTEAAHYETTQLDFIDRVLVIETPIALQVSRAQQRDTSSANEIELIIANQSNQATRLKMADDIIYNDSTLEHLKTEVENMHQFYLQLAQRKKQKK